MIFRVPILRATAIFAMAMSISPTARAQDPVAGELKALRLLVEQQGKQLAALDALVARLSAKIEGHGPVDPAPAAGNAEFVVPAAKVVAPPMDVHIVVKGESLEKIAKAHGTTITDLQKINRISDPKKLQIGQQLKLPPQTPKKEAP
jgi:LysM repeat protein